MVASAVRGGIEMTTWEINKKNGGIARRSGINTKQSIAVDQLDLGGNFLERYPSTREASRAVSKLAINGSHISAACYGKRLTAYGYKWRFSEIPNNNAEHSALNTLHNNMIHISGTK